MHHILQTLLFAGSHKFQERAIGMMLPCPEHAVTPPGSIVFQTVTNYTMAKAKYISTVIVDLADEFRVEQPSRAVSAWLTGFADKLVLVRTFLVCVDFPGV